MQIQTTRLTLQTLDLKLAKAAADDNRPLLEALLETKLDSQWPPSDLANFLPKWVELLTSDPGLAKWGVWLIIHRQRGLVIGDVGFKGRPGRSRTVELGVGILPPYRCLGFGTEATQGLIDWALEMAPIYTFLAEASPGDPSADRMLRRLGFKPLSASGSQALWSMEP